MNSNLSNPTTVIIILLCTLEGGHFKQSVLLFATDDAYFCNSHELMKIFLFRKFNKKLISPKENWLEPYSPLRVANQHNVFSQKNLNQKK